jgi:hypothetical protein
MASVFLAVPVAVWGSVCLVLAVVDTVLWPRPGRRSPPRSPWRGGVLRWGHALVWALLAGACFVWAAGLPGSRGVAKMVAGLALLVYLLFVTALWGERRRG